MRFIFLDWLRIFAFSSVLIGHKFMPELNAAINNPNFHATPKALLSFLMPFFQGGGAGVIVFFMVSGYIITHVLTQESTTQFLIRRIFRIYPLYIAAVIIEQILINSGQQIVWSNLILRCLLVGDFFSIPYALAEVEWTLRIEIMFYLLMALKQQIWSPSIDEKYFFIFLVLLVLIFSILPPFPNAPFLFKNYFFLYMPFIFLGVGFYLFEKGEINGLLFLGFIGLVFSLHWKGIALYQPNWVSAHFAFLGFMLFAVAWQFRNKFKTNLLIVFLSNLTYSVYLFHNWLFDYFMRIENSKFIALLLLCISSYMFYIIIEKPAISFGKKLSKKHSL